MAKYTKRPVTVDAVQWWPGKSVEGVTEGPYLSMGQKFPAKCKTLEGWLGVRAGDFIITGVKGERYPCKPDIFHQTYEAA